MNKSKKQELLNGDKFKRYFDKIRLLNMNPEYLHYVRHSQFIPDGKPPCDICGSKELIHPIGRYVCFDEEREDSDDDHTIFLCGNCVEELEKLGIETDYG